MGQGQATEQSGIWLLSVYFVLVMVSVCGAIILMFLSDKAVPTYAGWIFVTAMGVALVGPWPVALWITDRAWVSGPR